eukprot:GHVS01021786.1.p1 GENE.GHVS01021786.1~~GHVS01021786.1.p1  ORF type:complete len:236 (+),score=41.00 GHVS01021786.1:80-787(+)
MAWLLSFGSLFLLACVVEAKVPVTYGSSVALRHNTSGFKLFSAKIAWGSGSGQQAVTGIGGDNYDETVLWYVKEPHDAKASSATGSPVSCGSVVRLEHADSNKNLHSHEIPSPISGQNEVSAFGTNGDGNEGDNFVVECVRDGKINNSSPWTTKDYVALRHEGMHGFLKGSASKKFNRDNCPRCPIEGHMEIVVGNSGNEPTQEELWKAVDGVFLSNQAELEEEDDSSGGPHDEL